MSQTDKNKQSVKHGYKWLCLFVVFALVYMNVQTNRAFAQAEAKTDNIEFDIPVIGLEISDDSVRNEIEFEVPIMVNKGLSGNANAKIINIVHAGETDTEVVVSSSRLKNLFKNYANDEQLITWFGAGLNATQVIGTRGSTTSVTIGATVGEPEEIEQQGQAKEQAIVNDSISLQTLRERGLNISFDPALLAINTIIPRISNQTVSLRGSRNTVPEDAFTQAKFSSGLNFRARNTYVHRPTATNPGGLGDTTIDVDGFTTFGGFGGWSLYYGGLYDEGSEVKFRRRDVTLIHDSFKSGIRYSLGDFLSTSSGLQSSASLLGLNIERRYEQINPSRNIRPSGRSTFTLEREALVTFEVNGRIADTRRLQAGDYSVEDFPLAFGSNDVRVYVDDGTGIVEIANFSAFTDFNLLAPGISNFGLSLGVRQDTSTFGERAYEEDPVFYGFYERGLNERLTLGAQAEIAENQQLLGVSSGFGSSFGLFILESAISQREGFSTGFSTSLSYRNDIEFDSGLNINTNLQLDYQSENFGGIDTIGQTNERTSLRSSVTLIKNGYGFNVNGTLIDDNEIENKFLSASLTKSFGEFDLGLDYNFSQLGDDESVTTFGLSLSTRFGASTLRGQYQSANEQSLLGWNRFSVLDAGQGSINSITLQNNNTTKSAQLNGLYNGSRFLLGVDHLEAQSNTVDGNDTSSSTINFSTAIGFADGQFAVGKPFNDGFLILNPHKNLRGKKVSVVQGAREGTSITSTKHLSSTLVPLNSTYREQRLTFEVDDLPIGYDLGSSEVDLFPGFLAGYRYKIGSDAANTVIGRALWPDQTPPSLIVGKLISIESGDELTIFTNKTGRFVAESAKTGMYRLVFNKEGYDFDAEINVQSDSDEPGLIQLGTVILEKAGD